MGYLRAYPEHSQLEPIFRAYLSAWKGERVDAAKHFATVGQHGLEPVLASSRVLEFVAEIACATRDRALAELVYERLKPHAGRPLMVTGIGFSLHGVTDAALLRLASLLGKFDEADRHAEAALAFCDGLGARPIEARVRYFWAESLVERGGADALARARDLLDKALEASESLGMAWRAEQCRELAQRLSASSSATDVASLDANAGSPVHLLREGEYWTLSGFGDVCRIKDGRGMQMLAELLQSPKREIHALELSGSSEAVDGGDAGEVIDREARDAYTKRLRDLREELAEAEDWNDVGRRDRLVSEAEELEQELTRATGLGGRERRVGSAVERARINVRRRLSLVLRRIEETSPALGKHFTESVRTGTYCAYDPDK